MVRMLLGRGYSFLKSIKESSRQKKLSVCLPKAKRVGAVLFKLSELGYIHSYEDRGGSWELFLKYDENGKGLLDEIYVYPVSKNKFYTFSSVSFFKEKIPQKSSVVILVTTEKGLKTHYECRKDNIGGVKICNITL